jgi:ATP-binding cassette, subfamily B, bacterial
MEIRVKDLPHNSSFKLFLSFLNKQKGRVGIFTFVCILLGMTPAIDSIILQKITDTIENIPDNQASTIISVMINWVVIYTLWWQFGNLLWRVYDYVFLKFMPIIKGAVIEQLYDYTQHHYHKFFQENLAGSITSRITEGARSFEMIIVYLNDGIVRKLSTFFFGIITLYVVHYIFATIFAVWFIAFIALSLILSKRINSYSIRYASNKAIIAGKLVDSISNIAAVRMFTSHHYERKYLSSYLDQTIQSEQDMHWFMLKLRFWLGTLCALMAFAIMYNLLYLRSNSVITTGDCVLILVLCASVVPEVWELTQEVGDAFEEIGVFNQSLSLIEPYVLNDAIDANKLIVKSGAIEFKNVVFNFKDYNLFNNIAITIHGGQKVGLVGFSGSGKSTFANLIIRLYDVASGEILIDGQNIKNVTQDSLRQNISFIPQEPLLFHRTIMENIRYGKKEASDADVVEAAKLAHADEFITKLENGYNTLCGERGNNLSGGQRQRVIIARAILKNAPILILDEATSALDSNTEMQIQHSLNYLMQGKTVLVIAHRLSTILNMDRIIVFDKGNIENDATHPDLLNTSKIYQKLWKAQGGGLIGDGHTSANKK